MDYGFIFAISYVRRASRRLLRNGMHIRNVLPTGISYVRRASRCLLWNVMHIRNVLPTGISYVRRASRCLLRNGIHIRNVLPTGISYVHRASRCSGNPKLDTGGERGTLILSHRRAQFPDGCCFLPEQAGNLPRYAKKKLILRRRA